MFFKSTMIELAQQYLKLNPKMCFTCPESILPVREGLKNKNKYLYPHFVDKGGGVG